MAFAATTVWEARTTGSDSNGGGFDPGVAAPGTDFSVQDAPQTTYTDLVIDAATNTKVTSAAFPFGSTHPGNIINITGGTGFTVQRVVILSVAGNVATCDKSLGTLGSTGGAGKLGGGFASPGMAMSVAVQSNTLYIKAGTYTLTTTANVSGGRIDITVGGVASNQPFQVIGYNTTRTLTNTDATVPTLQTGATYNGTNAFLLITFSAAYCRARNIAFRNPSAFTGVNGVMGVYMNSLHGLCERLDIDGNGGTTLYGIFQSNTSSNHCIDCIVKKCSISAYQCGGIGNSFHGCIADSNTCVGFNGAGQFIRCIASNATGAASDGFQGTSAAGSTYTHCVAYNNARHGFAGYQDAKFDNCLAIKNGAGGTTGYGFGLVSSGNSPVLTLYNCAAFGNLQGDFDPTMASYNRLGFISLTGSPFTNAAGGDYSLNNTAGAGLACQSAGYPSTFYTISTSSSLDIGAAQHAGTGTTFIVKRPNLVR